MRLGRVLVAVLAGTLLVVPAPAVAATGTPSAALGSELDRILAADGLAGATVAVDVRDAGSGAVLYQRNPEVRVLPASNQKLLTAAAALEVLGPGYRFRTAVRALGGDLYLQGRGDPTMTYQRYDQLAAAVARAGTRRFAGRLIADDTWFDRVPLGLDWSWSDETYDYTAPISGLTFAANTRFDTAAVEVRYKGVAGKRPVVTVWPPTKSVRVGNRAVTRGSGDSVDAVRVHGTRNVTVSGAVAAGRSGTTMVAVPDPTATAAGIFRAALRRHGVRVAGRTSKGVVPGKARNVAALASPPLTEILRPLLKLSNNGHAEILVKAMSRATVPAKPGNWPAGLTAATAALRRLGVDTRLLTMSDGSGLSRRNWMTVRQVTTLLRAARGRTWFPAFRTALPVAGNPDLMIGGTLRNRMRGTPAAGNVRAKTGSLTGVNALSGYLTDVGGRDLVFAAIINGSVTSATGTLDSVAVTLAASRTAATVVPSARTPARL
ncbi:D-alanyl-D-alanine carboxypeptidase/D-alanyl-D-alanine endopeptidase [Actinoplanes derwentensis]|uniref:D-alanyl-D-alanine carboxypeptidase / D-alanyl-D-alanine-endopeptidase (Penicillin-binding protein 4) n=1 Tax=Actinoplanes derwentensis TaxID=113562 RepID=A0A1H1R5Q9_9ACTN|nr:D-alanyl-D-alanine carboxypeptidase/D-alanyl-D-alanine-endopeptidase [Actinoplanes derwentensis]GID88023.1 D-alanyl-D-alanine carboxypeptidase DacC [Actinoplanes derwentensis]SDS31073.1 D-alanyl-D-alanine carboxypeptidase / D-alanyl-D-alanine-endopeptidase (penicillin-binding protein 4) [Actinoplanes derwentensis]